MTPWRITWRHATFTDDDISVADACNIAGVVGDGWGSIDPWRSPVLLVGVTAVMAARMLDDTSVQAETAALMRLSAAQVLAIIEPRKPGDDDAL
jgi:hypothetical protein